MHRGIRAAAGACVMTALLSGNAVAQYQGPSSSQKPYVVPVAAGVKTVSILTVGDAVNRKPDGTPYRLVGIPDGMGAFGKGRKPFDLVMNHEIREGGGITRRHGQPGSFVSHWTINPRTLQVLWGEDMVHTVVNESAGRTTQMGRLCSADLAAQSAYYDKKTRLGSKAKILLSGEEIGSEGRLFAHVATGDSEGISYDLPAHGKYSWENALANPASGVKTLVLGTDDSTPGQLYLYVGEKQGSGTEVEKAGLTDGILYGIKVVGIPDESRDSVIPAGTRFELYRFGSVSGWSGATLQTQSETGGVTEFLRPEDAQWDPKNPRDFYFVTTDRFNTPTQTGRSRLYRLRFHSLKHPESGGTITTLLDGTEGQQMMDNMTIDRSGHVLIQEDPGNQAHLARIWQYTIATDRLKLIAEHNPYFFAPGSPGMLTNDEESSGIIDAEKILGRGWFLLNVQAHYPIPGELVEGGQLVALYNPDSARGRGDDDDEDDDEDDDDD